MVKDEVRKHINRPALIVGLLGIFVYLCLGYYLKIKLLYDYENWTKNCIHMKNYFRAAHVHGLLMSMLLLFYAFLVEVSNLSDRMKKIGTYLAIGGAVSVPMYMLMAAFRYKNKIFIHISIIMIICAVGILVWGHLKNRA